MSYFLLEYSYMWKKSAPRILTDRELRTALGSNIERLHYAGDGNDIAFLGLYRNGTLTPLKLEPAGEERRDADYLYWDFMLTDPGGSVVMRFTVTIDGRA